MRLGPPRPLRGDVPDSLAVGGREGSAWCHHACGQLLKGIIRVVKVEKVEGVVEAIEVAAAIKGGLAFHRAVAKKNKDHSSSVIVNTFQ